MNEPGGRVVSLFRDRKVQLIVNARHQTARLQALRQGRSELVDPGSAPPDELAARRAKNDTAAASAAEHTPSGPVFD